MELEIYKMLYNRENNNNLRILGNNFVKNNKNKGKLIVNNKKQKITEFINIILINDNRIKIKLLLSKNIPNKSCLCRDCTSLLKFSLFFEETKIREGNKINYAASRSRNEDEGKYEGKYEDKGGNESNDEDEGGNESNDEDEEGNYLDLYPEINNYDLERKFYSLDILRVRENSEKINSNSNDYSYYSSYYSYYSYSYISEKSNRKNIIEYAIDDINTIISKDIYFNLREMFYNCTSLYFLSDFVNFKDYNYNYKIIGMSYIFYIVHLCKNCLIYLHGKLKMLKI